MKTSKHAPGHERDFDSTVPFVFFTPVKAQDDKDLEAAERCRNKTNELMKQRNLAQRKVRKARRQGNLNDVSEQWTLVSKLRHDIEKSIRDTTFYTFRFYNPDYYGEKWDTGWLGTIDLHRLSVNEAKRIVVEHVLRCKEANLATTTIITGIGNNSEGGRPKIKPAVLELLEEMPEVLKREVDKTNVGQVIVEMLLAEI